MFVPRLIFFSNNIWQFNKEFWTKYIAADVEDLSDNKRGIVTLDSVFPDKSRNLTIILLHFEKIVVSTPVKI